MILILFLKLDVDGLVLKCRATFSSLSVSWAAMKDTNLEKDGRLPESSSQHLHIMS